MILWEYIVFVIAFVVFMLVMWLTKWLIRYLRRVNLVVPDVHKEGRPLVPISGGLAVAGGTISGLMIFIFFRTFFPQPTDRLVLNSLVITSLFAGIITILIITLIGFLDDLIVKLNRQESGGLKQWQKPLLTIAAAVPLMAINAGTSTMVLPFIGRIDIGVIYPLLFIPLGVVGSANMVNLLGGFNGMETGMGAVAVGMLGLFSLLKGHYLAALISLMAFAALSAFYWYNKVPARILPGDSLTYFIGGVLVVIAVIGNIEKAAIIVSIPFIIEFFLKLRGRFKKTTIGYEDHGKVKSHYAKVYSIPHFFTRTGEYTEKQVTYILIFIELCVSSLIWII